MKGRPKNWKVLGRPKNFVVCVLQEVPVPGLCWKKPSIVFIFVKEKELTVFMVVVLLAVVKNKATFRNVETLKNCIRPM